MYGFDEINEEEFTDIETIDKDKNLKEIKRLLEGKHTIEIDGVSEEIAKEALYKASAKLPIKTKFIKR